MSAKSQKQEMQDAQNKKRIPKCVSCNHKLLEISQTQYDYIDWIWNEATGRYKKTDSHGDADKPRHNCHVKDCPCEYQDWEFLDENSEADLGVSF